MKKRRKYACTRTRFMLLSQGKRLTPQTHALMVKRLRRRPLTAESGVRFPMRVPKKAAEAAFFFTSTGVPKKAAEAAFFICLNRGTKKGSRSCFFYLPQQGYQKRQQKLLFLFTSTGVPKRQQKLLFLFTSTGVPKKAAEAAFFLYLNKGTKKGSRGCFFLFTSTGVPKKAAEAAFFYLPRQGYQKRQQKLLFLFTSIAKSAQAMSAYANAAGGICTKKRCGGIETPRRRAPKTRNSHDAVWCHFINLHVQGGSTAAACFCLPLDEGA